jgi:hypothetical protein
MAGFAVPLLVAHLVDNGARTTPAAGTLGAVEVHDG